MLIVSQNLVNYGYPISDNTILRINLAWINSLEDLKTILRKHRKHSIFLDLPIGRTKPPNNNFSLDDLIPIIESHPNIEYFAISNVQSQNDLTEYIKWIPNYVTIVPKIENEEGILNIKEITNILSNKEKIVMLDHDDLYSSIVRANKSPLIFKELINKLIDFCKNNNIVLLRTRGVIFSDDEKRAT